eukprot:SAG31_NODE_35763_length_320_cov_0.696833_1_plen_44_part_10
MLGAAVAALLRRREPDAAPAVATRLAAERAAIMLSRARLLLVKS